MEKYAGLLDHECFQRISTEMNEYDEKREIIIRQSRDILKASKQAIFSMHRNALDDANMKLLAADQVIAKLSPIIVQDPSLRSGSFSAAMEEYAEAKCFLHFLTTGKLVSLDRLNFVDRDEYLAGVVDFTGEIGRYAVAQATQRNLQRVEECRDIIEAISGELIQFTFRNGPLRKKYDALKYNLKKVEEILYDLSLVAPGRQFKMKEGSTEDQSVDASKELHET